jgi:cytochrome P450/NADPH-cytochrome P450 reductase
MLKGKDPVTGEVLLGSPLVHAPSAPFYLVHSGKGLSHENIRNQLVTFLIAGHETTSGMLSFLFHYLLSTPRAYQAIRREVDEVCGSGPVELQHLSKLKYLDAALKETLRLQPTAPVWTVAPFKDEVICDGKYLLKAEQPVGVLLHSLHRDPSVWGDDVEDFR